MTKLHELVQLGQSIWYDNIRRKLIDSGELQKLLDDGVMGVTSNPSIFEKAIGGSNDYDDAIAAAEDGISAESLYESLAIEDIQRAADLLKPIYDKTERVDGYISLEVSPALAHNTEATVAAAQRLYAAVNRPNVMIKVPATPAGVPAIEQLISEGININVTLLFALSAYEAVVKAYIAGVKTYFANGGTQAPASVASFFISRVDVAVDKALEAAGNSELQGKIGIANAKLAYEIYQNYFEGADWAEWSQKGAQVQRLLWASTGTKNAAYPDTLYVDELIGMPTVNTVPPKTLAAFVDHGTAAATLANGLDDAKAQVKALADLGINLDDITQALLTAGVASFAQAFERLLVSVADKQDMLANRHQIAELSLNAYADTVDAELIDLKVNDIMARIWQHDHTVWRDDPAEISNRLGWLHMPVNMRKEVERLDRLKFDLEDEGYTDVILVGMGGSSLAPEVFYKTFGNRANGLKLHVLDSTDPDRVLEIENAVNIANTAFIIATKSGGTAETLSGFKHFYNKTIASEGLDNTGKHFIAITDPGSKLEKIAADLSFRTTFLNDPTIGGRYAALSFFGLVPAALVGVDVDRLLKRAWGAAVNSEEGDGRNYSAELGAVMGVLAKLGRNKLTLITSPALTSFGDWAEQLVAESTGKDGKGILPVVGEPPSDPAAYGNDRLFVHLRLADDTSQDAAIAALKAAAHPVVQLNVRDVYDLGEQFFIWEIATAVSGHILKIQPFDQPDVEAAKNAARAVIADYMEKGELPAAEVKEISAEILQAFLYTNELGDYVSIHAYVQPTPETDAALFKLRDAIRDATKMATTIGYGPRFLHSTGQLHKGDAGNGFFIQLINTPAQDVPIPDEAGNEKSTMTFGVLRNAQALGDANALQAVKRRVVTFDLGSDVVGGIDTLIG